MLAVHIPLDNVLFLVFVGVAMLFRLLANAATKKTKPDDEERPRRVAPPRAAPADDDSDSERIRKFLEALGQPTSPPPPRRVVPRTQVPPAKPKVVRHVPPLPSPLPPLTTRPPDLPRRFRSPGQITTPPYEEKTLVSKAPEPASFTVQQSTAEPPPPPVPAATPAEAYARASQPPPATRPVASPNLLTLLRSPDSLRQAIVLREIFGPPRAFSAPSDDSSATIS